MPAKKESEVQHTKTPRHLKDGPLRDRKCTDILCLLVFVGFWAGMIAIGYIAVSTGKPMALTYAYDKNHNACGVDLTTDYPYLLFIRDNKDKFVPYRLNDTSCVKNCPTGDSADPGCYGQNCSNQGQFSTVKTFKRFCLPIDVADQQNLLSKGLNFGFFSRAASDLIVTWPMIFGVGVFALVFGFIYVILMKFFSGVIIWSLLAVFILGSGGFGYVCFETTPDSGSELSKLGATWLKVISYTCFAVACISLLLVICLKDKIKLSIAILKAAAHFLGDEPGILALPPILLVFTLLFYGGWVVVTAFILGTNDIKQNDDGMPFADLDWTEQGTLMFAYYLFALLWNHALGVALSQFIIASTVSIWYFKQGIKKGGNVSPFSASVKRSVYHMGSLAFGSFLIGFLQFIKHVLDYAQSKVKLLPAGENAGAGARFILSCCSCCVGCFERSLKFLTTHAYIQIAMTGESFCKATAEAFCLVLRNAVRFGMVHGFAYVFLFFGQIIISGCAAFSGYLVITQVTYFKQTVISPVVPAIVFFLSSYMIAHTFMSIYGMSADTIVHCFAMDEEIHDGAIMHAPEELRDYIDHDLNKKLLAK